MLGVRPKNKPGLIPCAFCGQKKPQVVKIDFTGFWEVICSNKECAAGGPIRPDRQLAKDAWQKRSKVSSGN